MHAFLRELSSERWGDRTAEALVAAGGGPGLVEHPDLGDDGENAIRIEALRRARGWGTGEGMFRDFPSDIEWSHGALEPAEVERCRYIDYSYWNELSGGSRRVVDVGPTLQANRVPQWLADLGTAWCWELAAAYRAGLVTPDLIVLATPDLASLVVVEGHCRITGIVLSGVYRQRWPEAFIGVAADAERWMP